MREKLLKLSIFILLVSCTMSVLVIRSPASLKQYFEQKYNSSASVGIPYSIANFGDVPYGRSIIG